MVNTNLTPIDPEHSVAFDVHVWSDHPEVNKLVDSVWDKLGVDIQAALTGTSNNTGTPPKRILKKLLIDLYVNWLDDPTLCIGVPRGNDHWTPTSRYNALHIPKKINTVIDYLVDLDLLDFIGGRNDRKYGGRFSHTSRIRPTAKLHKLFIKCSATEFDFHHDKAETIILNEFDTDAEGNIILTTGRRPKKKVIVKEYNDTKATKQMRETVKAYNAFLHNTYIDVSTLEEPFIVREKDKKRVAINQSKKSVRRVFSRGKWKYNGRFYGGFWQSINTDYRANIRIDDVPVVEVDYKSLHPAILAAAKGVDFNKDCYDFGEVIIPRLTASEQRAAVKLLVLTAINASERDQAFQAHRDGSDITLKNVELSKLLDTFIGNNPYLQSELLSDKGIELMYMDSQITEIIIQNFLNADKPILSVHDSYLVQEQDVDLLLKQMKLATDKVVGKSLNVDQDYLSYGQAQQRINDFKQDPAVNPLELLNLTPKPNRTSRYINTYKRFVNWQSFANPSKLYNMEHLNN